MQVKVDSVSAVEKKLSVSIPEERVQTEIEEAFKQLSKKIAIPGFRAGKVPRTILEQRFGASVEADVYQDLVQKTVSEALTEHKLDAIRVYDIAEPKRKKGEGFSYVASIEVKPEIEPKDYLGIKVEASKTVVKEEQIQEVLKRLQDSQAVLKHREGVMKPTKGDFVGVTLQECDETGTVKATKEELREQTYEVGAELLQPEIEKGVTKITLGESTVVPVKLQNPDREIHAKLTLKTIKEKILPTLDDEFAKSVGPFADLNALREQVTKDLQTEVEQKAKSETVRKILDEIVKKNPLMLPETLVHEELHHMMEGLAHRMAQAGIQKLPDDYHPEKLEAEFRPEAAKHVHEQLLIEAVAKKEGLTIEEKEVSERIVSIAKAAKVPPGELRAHYEKSGKFESLRFQLLSQKTLDFLLSKANVK
ncbi:MAG: trigger factor [Pseudomonadota bacterium]